MPPNCSRNGPPLIMTSLTFLCRSVTYLDPPPFLCRPAGREESLTFESIMACVHYFVPFPFPLTKPKYRQGGVLRYLMEGGSPVFRQVDSWSKGRGQRAQIHDAGSSQPCVCWFYQYGFPTCYVWEEVTNHFTSMVKWNIPKMVLKYLSRFHNFRWRIRGFNGGSNPMGDIVVELEVSTQIFDCPRGLDRMIWA